MVLVLFIFIILIISLLIVLLSNIKINVKKFILDNEVPHNPIIKEIEISIGIYLLNKIRIFNKNIEQEDLQKAKNSEKFNEIKNKFMKQEKMKEKKQDIKRNIDIFKELNVKLDKLNLNIEIGTEDVILTSFLVAIIAILVSMGLAKVIKKYNKEKYNYNIEPIYCNKNVVKIDFKSIIQIKLVNIISVFFKILFRRNEHERTSNRRAYANCNE